MNDQYTAKNRGYLFNPAIENKKKALEAYKQMMKLTDYFKGETNQIILQNAKVVVDGLEKIIMLKKMEIKKLKKSILSETLKDRGGKNE